MACTLTSAGSSPADVNRASRSALTVCSSNVFISRTPVPRSLVRTQVSSYSLSECRQQNQNGHERSKCTCVRDKYTPAQQSKFKFASEKPIHGVRSCLIANRRNFRDHLQDRIEGATKAHNEHKRAAHHSERNEWMAFQGVSHSAPLGISSCVS